MSLLTKVELNTVEFVISKDLIDAYVSHCEFISANMLLESNEMEKAIIKNPNNR